MIILLCLCYSVFYILFFNKLKLFRKSVRNISIFVGIGVVLIGTILFMWWTFAPTAKDARVFQYVIPIVPNVKGQVIEVPVKPLVKLNKGDVLYKIDPAPFQFAVNQLKASIEQADAQKKLAEIEVKRTGKLVRKSAAAQSNLDRWTANLAVAEAAIASLNAQLDNAQWQLDETVVRAPHAGFVANLQLRPGNFVTNMPVAAAMTFVSDETREVLASFSQSAIRYIQVGDPAEVVFATDPGQVYSGKISHIIKTSGEAQLATSGQLPTFTGQPVNARWVVRVAFDDPESAASLAQSAAGTMLAVYTHKGKPFHIISKVVIRMQAWSAYLTSP
ncbi:MAG: HlyD family secretion protein [Deltaproteobacteria bacterium]|nr:HlyD family secretion protein [Deltaproteobacteria bacterium]